MGCERRVLLAFSGGNDSCAAVGILRAQGYEPTLLTLDMTGDRSLLARARRAAEALDTPLLTADVRTSFTRRIVDYFASGYLTGETPAPVRNATPASSGTRCATSRSNEESDVSPQAIIFACRDSTAKCSCARRPIRPRINPITFGASRNPASSGRSPRWEKR